MLALTEHAVEAIEGILAAPAVPEEAGIRIAPPSPIGEVDGAPEGLRVTVAEAPDDSHEVIEEGSARVFLDERVADDLDDRVLDARIVDQRVSFTLGER